MPEELEIRQANESDIDALAALVAELGYPTEVSIVGERLNDLTGAGGTVLVAVQTQNVVGLAVLLRTLYLHRPPDGRIATLVVSRTYRNRGIGARLVAAAETIFRESGCERVEVTSGIEREAAHRFYNREGYNEQRKRFVKRLSPPLPSLTL